MELTKADKKAAREIIETGLQNEFKQGLLEAAAIIQEWEKKSGDNREYYHQLFSKIYDFDKHIARRYDYMSGSRYLLIIAAQLNDGVISEADILKLPEEARQAIERIRH